MTTILGILSILGLLITLLLFVWSLCRAAARNADDFPTYP